MRTPKQIAVDISQGDKKAMREIEKMFGKKFVEMTKSERMLGVVNLSAFDGQWDK